MVRASAVSGVLEDESYLMHRVTRKEYTDKVYRYRHYDIGIREVLLLLSFFQRVVLLLAWCACAH